MKEYIGHPLQIRGAECFSLCGGKGDGMKYLSVRNGLGLALLISLDRCADLARVTFNGKNMGYFSPCGHVAPAYYDKDGAGFLKSFTAGFFTTCGLRAVGSPCTDEGEVLVDGINVRDYSLKNLRDGVGMVLQKNVLFSGTIEDNLRWGDESATDEELVAAADAAQADGFIRSFTDGYKSQLEQGGVNVSGGQKQRLCIARALLKKPKILILDDSTSAVDTATEAKIREQFRTGLRDSTKIIIAQRITSVMDADMIVVMNDGAITGMGTHSQLLENNEEYREIYISQMEGKDTANTAKEGNN